MTMRQNLLSMTAAAALLALPVSALAQQGGSSGGGSSMQTTTTQTSPQQGPLSGSPGARAGTESGGTTGATVRGGNAGSPMGGAAGDRQVPPSMQAQGHAQTQGGQAGAQGRDASGGVMAQTTTPGTAPAPRDGTPGNPPSTAVGRAVDQMQGQTPRPDGTPGNPPGTAAGRAVDRTLGTGSVTGPTAPDGTPGNPPGTAAGRAVDRTLGTNTTGTNPAGTSAATGAAATMGAGAAMVPMDSAALRSGRRASKVIGSNIYNENNESVGEVDDIIIPPGGGAPVAVISVGGFLGIGSKLVAVPYDRLQMNAERNRWTLSGATKDSLNGLPTFSYDAAAGERRG